jgi:HSP20 family protein
MLRTLVNVDPLADIRAMDEMLDRMFGTPHRTGPSQPTNNAVSGALLPVDVLEKDNRFIVRAAAPGVKPEDLDIQIENNVLTIRGELKQEHEEQDVKVYRREYSYGTFSRSIRLPDNVNLEGVEAQFEHGFVTITIPRVEEPKPKALKVPVRTGQQGSETRAIEQHAETKKSGKN